AARATRSSSTRSAPPPSGWRGRRPASMSETRTETQAATQQPKLLGARVTRVEDPRFLTGNGRYVDDIALPGMLHVAFVRSTMAHADITGVNVDAAASHPGVHAGVTGAEMASQAKPITCDSLVPTWQAT